MRYYKLEFRNDSTVTFTGTIPVIPPVEVDNMPLFPCGLGETPGVLFTEAIAYLKEYCGGIGGCILNSECDLTPAAVMRTLGFSNVPDYKTYYQDRPTSVRIINPNTGDYIEDIYEWGHFAGGWLSSVTKHYVSISGTSVRLQGQNPHASCFLGYTRAPRSLSYQGTYESIGYIKINGTWRYLLLNGMSDTEGQGTSSGGVPGTFPSYGYFTTQELGSSGQGQLTAFWNQAAPESMPDPNDQGGTSEPGGGGGDFDDESDPIPLPPLPTVSATDCGLVTAFVPSRANLISLGNYLYSSLMDLDTLKRIFDQPMEHIIGLNILPFTPTTSSTKEITFANFSTGITGVPYISQQYQEVDCGTLEVKEYWGSALDYSPNTRAYLWLPHIGFVQVDVDIIMNTTCRVVYRVDTVTGTCMAVLIVNGSVINHWTGELALNIPLSSADYSRVIGAILGIAGTAIGVGAAIGGAMKAGEALGAAETTLSGLSASGASGQTKAMAADALTSAATQYNEAKGALAVTVAKGSVNTVSDVMGAKLGIQMSGAISGQAGIMDVQKPYFLFIRPNQSLAENYKHYVGYPSNMYASVESCKGFTIFEQIELKGITATDSEIAEISKLLKGGFYG